MGRNASKNRNLPPRMRARQQRSGKIYYYFDAGGKPRKEIPLGCEYTQAIIKWAELEAAGREYVSSTITLGAISIRYQREVLIHKASRTQKDNLVEMAKLLEFFGNDAPIEAIEPIHVRQYLTWRKDAPIRANREKALLSHMFNMARDWGLTRLANPCAGIKNHKESGRQLYVEDAVYNAVYASACQPVKDAMDLAYLAGQRVSDTLKMSEADIKDGFLHVSQAKTKKRLRIAIEGRLAEVIDRITSRKAQHKIRVLQLICAETGRPLSYVSLNDRFTKARKTAAGINKELAADIKAFQLRDLRAKAGTDKLENTRDMTKAQELLGHSTLAMTEHYIRERLGDSVSPNK